MTEPSDPTPQSRDGLLRPTGVNGEVSGVPRNPTQEDLARLFDRAFASGDGVDYGLYETALLRRYFKDFTDSNGIDRFAYTTYEREQINPINIHMRLALSKYTHSDGSFYESQIISSLNDYTQSQHMGGNIVGGSAGTFRPSVIDYASRTSSGIVFPFYNSRNTPLFAATFLHSGEYYKTNNDSPESYIVSDSERRTLAMYVAEHETGHTINNLRGDLIKFYVREEDDKSPENAEWCAHVSESVADTYAVLRMASLRGQEGIDQSSTIIKKKLIPDTDDKTHWTARSMLNAQEYAQSHLKELQSKTPEEVYELALQIVSPIPKDEYLYLRNLNLNQLIDQVEDGKVPLTDTTARAIAGLNSDWERIRSLPPDIHAETKEFTKTLVDKTYNPADPAMRENAQKHLQGYPKLHELLPDQIPLAESFGIESRASALFTTNVALTQKVSPHLNAQIQDQSSPENQMFSTIASSLRLIALHGSKGEEYITNMIENTPSGPEGKRQIAYYKKALEIAHNNPEKMPNLDRNGCYDLALNVVESFPQLRQLHIPAGAQNQPQESVSADLSWSAFDQGTVTMPSILVGQQDVAPPTPTPVRRTSGPIA